MKPLFTPEQKAEIARRYQAGASLAALATAYGCWPTTISDQLAAMGIPRRTLIPSLAKRIVCPYSAEALRLMYWREGKSLQEIADHATALLERTIRQNVVTRWLKEAGITLRTHKEAQELRTKLHPEQNQPGLQEAHRRGRRPTPTEFRPFEVERMRQVQKIGIRAWRKKGRANFETRPCANPACKNQITRKPYEFTRPPERTFCSQACINTVDKRFVKRGPRREKP